MASPSLAITLALDASAREIGGVCRHVYAFLHLAFGGFPTSPCCAPLVFSALSSVGRLMARGGHLTPASGGVFCSPLFDGAFGCFGLVFFIRLFDIPEGALPMMTRRSQGNFLRALLYDAVHSRATP